MDSYFQDLKEILDGVHGVQSESKQDPDVWIGGQALEPPDRGDKDTDNAV